MKLTPRTFRLNIIELCEGGANENDISDYIYNAFIAVKRTPENLEIMAHESRDAGMIHTLYLHHKEEFYKLKHYLLEEEER